MSTTSAPATWKLRTEPEFIQFYAKQLQHCLAACETERKGVARNLMLLIGAVVLVATIAAVIILPAVGHPGVAMVIFFLAVAIIGVGWSAITKGYRQRFKLNVVSQVITFFGPEFEYNPERFIPQYVFESSRLFEHRIDRYRGEDYLCGVAGKTRFEASEVHAEYKVRRKNRTSWHTIFKGLFFIADFNKQFHGITLVLPDLAQARLGWLGQKLQEMNVSRPGDLVKLEDPTFEKLYVVYSTDQIEARYILSPSLMQRLSEFRQQNGEVHLAFIGGNVYLALKTSRDLLEPSIFSPVDFKVCYRIYQDIALTIGIIEELNLNTRIWSKA